MMMIYDKWWWSLNKWMNDMDDDWWMIKIMIDWMMNDWMIWINNDDDVNMIDIINKWMIWYDDDDDDMIND